MATIYNNTQFFISVKLAKISITVTSDYNEHQGTAPVKTVRLKSYIYNSDFNLFFKIVRYNWTLLY